MIFNEPVFNPGGDRFIEMELGDEMSFDLNFLVHNVSGLIRESQTNGIIEIVPELTSIMISYDFEQIRYADVVKEMSALFHSLGSLEDLELDSRMFYLPLHYFDEWTRDCYDDYCAKIAEKEWDPEVLVRINGLSGLEQLAQVHSGTDYWVAALGFYPGLVSLMPLDPRCRLTAPKYNPPRTWTYKGTIGVGGALCSIYPDQTPGGYQMIARTPVPIWDPAQILPAFKESLALFRPGDRVRFIPATREEYDYVDRQVEAGVYLHNVAEYQRFSILTHAHALRLRFEGKKAVGVDYARRGQTAHAAAAKAVILCAGSFGSPQLLMLSGVGPAAHLRDVGIETQHDLPGVGENLQDHAGANCTKWVNRTTYNVQTGFLNYLIYGTQWLLTGTGPASSPVAQVGGFRDGESPGVRSRIQYLFTPGGFDLAAEGPILFDKPAVTGLANIHRPYSCGSVRLKSANSYDAPAIQPNLFSDERDVETLLHGTKFLRQIFATEPLSGYVIGEHMPGKDVQTDEDWRAYIRSAGTGVYHPAGTCKMGHDAMAVVDDGLRVRGLESLYVADASIMPFVVSANLNASCIMIGEKASDMIRAAT